MTRRTIRFGGALALAGALLALSAGPAAADPPGPTNYRTEIVGIEPAVDGVDAEILGGDSFLRLITDGVEVVVPGYDGEELYLRFEPDGSVFENQRSRTYFQNQARYSVLERDLPSDTGEDVPPDWVQVSDDGSYAWHDHRIHWMSPTTLPFAVSEDGSASQVTADGGEQLTTVFSQPIEIRVDGQVVGIEGDLYYLPDASPLVAIIAAIAGLAAIITVGLRRPVAAVVGGVVIPGALAVAVGIPQVLGLPSGVVPQPLQLVIPLIAVVVGLAGWAAQRRSPAALVVAGAGAVPLIAHVLVNASVFTAPIVPPDGVSGDVSRLILGLAVGGGVGAAVIGLRDMLSGAAVATGTADAEPVAAPSAEEGGVV